MVDKIRIIMNKIIDLSKELNDIPIEFYNKERIINNLQRVNIIIMSNRLATVLIESTLHYSLFLVYEGNI